MSVYSQRSSSSKGTQRVAKKSHVDEALFGTKKPSTAIGHIRDPEEIKQIMNEVKQGQLRNPNAAIITRDDLIRMRNNAIVSTKEEQLNQVRIHQEQIEKQLAAAKAKKQRMLDLEEERKKNVPPTESEIEDKIRSNFLQNRAQTILNEQMDEVKHMNQMVLYAKVATVRDRQLEEKKALRETFKVQEKRKDLMMEIDRLKKIKHYDDAEREKKEDQRRKALEVVDQIKEREVDRLRAQEEKEREGQEMIKAMRQVHQEEAQLALKRKAKQRDLNEEIYQTNQNAIVNKAKKAQEERDEEEKIVQYNLEKAQKEADYLAEQKRIKDEKEREVQRLRDLQEKVSDRQAEMDALRAKRAAELAERKAREKERNEAEQRAKMNQDLFEARRMQALEKEMRLQEQAQQERDAFQQIIYQQKAERDLELQTEQQRLAMIKNHASQLKKQIAINEEKTRQDKRNYLEEGKKIKDKLAHEKRVLEQIKTEKLVELKGQNIPTKYQAELAKKKIII